MSKRFSNLVLVAFSVLFIIGIVLLFFRSSDPYFNGSSLESNFKALGTAFIGFGISGVFYTLLYRNVSFTPVAISGIVLSFMGVLLPLAGLLFMNIRLPAPIILALALTFILLPLLLLFKEYWDVIATYALPALALFWFLAIGGGGHEGLNIFLYIMLSGIIFISLGIITVIRTIVQKKYWWRIVIVVVFPFIYFLIVIIRWLST